MNSINIENLYKSYGRGQRKHQALSGLSLKANQGQVLCLLGPNGAGKSTTIKIILGLIRPDKGSVEILGGSPFQLSAKACMASAPQENQYPDNLTVEEIIEFVLKHYSIEYKMNDVLERFNLSKIRNRKARILSGGEKRCLSLTCVFASQAQVIFLDEPTIGLDVEMRSLLWKEMAEYKSKGGTVLFTTHYLKEAEQISDLVTVIDKGKNIYSGSVKETKHKFGLNKVSCKIQKNLPWLNKYKYKIVDDEYQFVIKNSDKLVKRLVHSSSFSQLRVEESSLEEAFFHIVEGKPQ